VLDTDDDTPFTITPSAYLAGLEEVRDASYWRGVEVGRDEGRQQILKAMASMNGSTAGVLAFIQKAFDENEKRDEHGRWTDDAADHEDTEPDHSEAHERWAAEDSRTEDERQGVRDEEASRIRDERDENDPLESEAFDKTVERREREDERIERSRERQGDKEDDARSRQQEKELRKLEKQRERAEAKAHERIEEELTAERDAREEAIEAERTRTLAALDDESDEYDAADKAFDEQIAALDGWQETELSVRISAWEDAEAERQSTEDVAIMQRHAQEDRDAKEARWAREEVEDAARQSQRDEEDAATSAQWGAGTQSLIDARHAELETGWQAEDTATYHSRGGANGPAHEAYYLPDDHTRHGGRVGKAFDPDQPRDHGKFGTTGGAKDGPDAVSGNDVLDASNSDHHGGDSGAGARDAAPVDDPDAKAASLAARIAEVPAHVAAKVRTWVQARYAKLAARYGETGAKAILGAMVLLAPTPIPGSSLLPVAIAEAVLRIRRAVEGESVQKAAAHAPKGGVSVGGKKFAGGEFIPGEVMANATEKEKAKVEGGDKGDVRPEWDGTIDQGSVRRDRGWHENNVTSWDFYDDEGGHFPQTIALESGEYDPFPDDPDADPIPVYRWVSYQDGDGYQSDTGEWVADEDKAREEGEEFAEDSNQNEPEQAEEEDEDATEDDDDETEEDDDDAVGTWKEIFGEDAPDASDLLGVPGATGVEMSLDDDKVEVTVRHPKLEDMVATVGRTDDGEVFVHIDLLIVKENHQKEGLGAEIFTAQVAACADAGVSWLECHAAGPPMNPHMNGYYTWPRFGYDQPITKFKASTQAELKERFPGAKSVLDIMAHGPVELSPEEFAATKAKLDALDKKLGKQSKERTSISGGDWWKVNGTEMLHAKFDLTPGSRSLAVVKAYQAEMKKKSK
jgi:hypothetical protein